jgi:hypothetical protein
MRGAGRKRRNATPAGARLFILPGARHTSPMRTAVFLCGLLAALGNAPSVAAAPSTIEWEAPAPCPDTQALHERLRVLLGHESTSLGSVTEVRGVVARAGLDLRLTLELTEEGQRSSRMIVAQDCADLLEAAALAITLAAHGEPDPLATGAVPPGAEHSAAEPTTRPSAVDALEATADPDLGGSVGAEAVLDFGALPSPAPGVAVEASAHLGAWALGIGGTFLPTQRLGVGRSEHVEFGLLLAGLHACRKLLSGAWSISACVGFEAGQLSARGPEPAAARQVEDLWLAPGAGVGVSRELLGDLQLRLRAEPVMPLLRKQYAVNETEGVHAPAAIDLRLFVGLTIGAP